MRGYGKNEDEEAPAEEMRTYVCTPASLAARARDRFSSTSILCWASREPAFTRVVPRAERKREGPLGWGKREGHVEWSAERRGVRFGEVVGRGRRV